MMEIYQVPLKSLFGLDFCMNQNFGPVSLVGSVADHFNEEEHTENRLDFKINVVGQESNKNRRLRLEEAWMLLLNTHHPNGLNSKW